MWSPWLFVLLLHMLSCKHLPSLKLIHTEADCGSNFNALLALRLQSRWKYIAVMKGSLTMLVQPEVLAAYPAKIHVVLLLLTLRRSIVVVFPLLSSPTTSTLTCIAGAVSWVCSCKSMVCCTAAAVLLCQAECLVLAHLLTI
jgi:hypothetical protein